MSDFHSILYEIKNGVATITLNRPERMNAIDWNMPIEIRQAVEMANFDEDVKVENCFFLFFLNFKNSKIFNTYYFS